MDSKKKKEMASVISQKEIAENIFDLWIETDLAVQAKPGQFLCLYPKDGATLLPRPISICETDSQRNGIRLVYRIAGKGTAEFSTYGKGERIPVLGCLGNGFPLEAGTGKTALLMGGGIGLPPLLHLAKKRSREKNIILAGYRDASTFLSEDFRKHGDLYIATEDGSVGTKGNVMDCIRKNKLKADLIYACGPMPMLKAIKQFAEENQITAYISLEERMACGVGACLGCVCKTKHTDSHSHVHNARVCTDGPVFDSREVEI